MLFTDYDRGTRDKANTFQVSTCVRFSNTPLAKIIITDEPKLKKAEKETPSLIGGTVRLFEVVSEELGSMIQSTTARILNVKQTTFLFLISLKRSLMCFIKFSIYLAKRKVNKKWKTLFVCFILHSLFNVSTMSRFRSTEKYTTGCPCRVFVLKNSIKISLSFICNHTYFNLIFSSAFTFGSP